MIPLVPRTARTIDLAVGERHDSPILRRRDGHRLDRRTAHPWVHAIAKRTGLGPVHPHMLRAAFIMAALDAGVPARCTARGPSRGSAHHNHLRPPPPQLRPPRRLRRRRLVAGG
jgi:integrase